MPAKQTTEGATKNTVDAPYRAKPPRPPELGAGAKQASQEHGVYLRDCEALRHRSLLRGLLVLAVIALAISLYRAGLSRAFFPRWWQHW